MKTKGCDYVVSLMSKYGAVYEEPYGLKNEQNYYEIMDEFINFAKIKGLTVRQAQKLFTDCADAVLGTEL